MVKSEHGSPHMLPQSNLDQLNGQLPLLDLSTIPGEFNFMHSLDGFATVPDHEPPMFSAGLSSASIDWSHYDGLDFNNDNFATSSYSQAPSFTGFDFSSVDQPALTTTSTSGEISEVEDFVPLNENNGARPSLLNNQYGSDFDNSDFGDIDGYRLSTASSYIGMPQAQMLASNNFDSLGMDAFLKGVHTSGAHVSNNHGLPTANYLDDGKFGHNTTSFDDTTNFQPMPTEEDNDAFWMQSFVPSGVPANNSHSETPGNNNWAQ